MDNFEDYFNHLEKIITHLIDINKSEESSKEKPGSRSKNTVIVNNTIEKSCSNTILKKNSISIPPSTHQTISNETIKKSIQKILSNDQPNDWLNYLNIGNIMFLSSLNLEDLDLESESKFELLRDAMVEKVTLIYFFIIKIVMLTVSYFCIATELKVLKKIENIKLQNPSTLSK